MNLRAEKETRDNGVITTRGIINQRAFGLAAKKAPLSGVGSHRRPFLSIYDCLFFCFLSFRLCLPPAPGFDAYEKKDFKKKCVCLGR